MQPEMPLMTHPQSNSNGPRIPQPLYLPQLHSRATQARCPATPTDLNPCFDRDHTPQKKCPRAALPPTSQAPATCIPPGIHIRAPAQNGTQCRSHPTQALQRSQLNNDPTPRTKCRSHAPKNARTHEYTDAPIQERRSLQNIPMDSDNHIRYSCQPGTEAVPRPRPDATMAIKLPRILSFCTTQKAETASSLRPCSHKLLKHAPGGQERFHTHRK